MEKIKVKKEIEVKPRVGIDIDTLMFHLWNIKGTTFAQLKTCTEPKMRKTDNPYYDNVVKQSNVNVLLGGNYENNINSARIREAIKTAESVGVDKETLELLMEKFGTSISEFTQKFKAKPHKWADHSLNPLTGELSRIIVEKRSDPSCKYIQVWILDTKEPVYYWKNINEVIDNETLKDVESFIIKPKSNAEYQGLKKEIIIRDYYAIDNIVEITLNKTCFFIK